ncbi:MAG: DUF2799 domain-containing protein [Gammaproteobacteria bacterium]|nr:DUF2799 domain-containing protein [Gammaproteobacteria bacterium]
MRYAILWPSLVTLLLVSGCASLSESQCIASDWETIGYTDGSQGRSNSYLLKHQNACVKHGVVPDRTAYHDGWNQGIRQYCRPQNGFVQGERGAAYSNICPSTLEVGFHAAYTEGRTLYLAQAEINDMERQVGYRQQRLKEVKAGIVETEAAIIGGGTTAVERLRLLDETKNLAKEQGELETQITEITVDIAVYRERLEGLRQTVAYSY